MDSDGASWGPKLSQMQSKSIQMDQNGDPGSSGEVQEAAQVAVQDHGAGISRVGHSGRKGLLRRLANGVREVQET